jgi:tape measure domain-containing protein
MITDYARLVIEADSRGVRTASDDMSRLDGATSKTSSALTMLKPLLVAVGAALSVGKIVDYTNRWTDLNSRLVNATGSQEAANEAMAALSATARTTYSSLEQTAEAFLLNSMTLKELGFTTNQQVQLTDVLNNSLVVSGTKGQQAASVMDALSKAFAFGELRGQNFNTVIQSGGRVVQALADGLNVGTVELRALALQGELTTQRVIPALLSQMEKVSKEAERMPATIGDGFLLLRDAIFQTVGRMDQATGATGALANVLVSAADRTRALGLFIEAANERSLRWEQTWDELRGAMTDTLPVMDQILAQTNNILEGTFRLTEALNLENRSLINNAEYLQTIDNLYGESARQRQRHTQIVGEQNLMSQMLNRTVQDKIEVLAGSNKATERTIVIDEDFVAITKGSTIANKEKSDAIKKAREETERSQKATNDVIASLYDEINALNMSSLELQIQTAVRKAGSQATAEEIAGIEAMVRVLDTERTTRENNAEAVRVWQSVADSATAARTKAEEEAAKRQQEAWTRTHEYMTNMFIDIYDNGSNAFKKIGDAFVAMIKRMVAEWAASKVMELFGFGNGGVQNPFQQIAGSPIGQLFGGGGGGGGDIVSSLLGGFGGGGGGSVAAGADWSTGAPATTGGGSGVNMQAAGTMLATAAAGIAGGYVGTEVGESVTGRTAGSSWGATAGGTIGGYFGGPVGAFIGSAIGGLIDSAFGNRSFSHNAGMIVGPMEYDPERMFQVDPFASGFQPIGMNRRSTVEEALAVISAFGAVDEALTEAIRMAGGTIDMSSATLSGYDEKGQGDGVFMGLASEYGTGVTSVDIGLQLAKYASDVMRHAHGLTEEQKASIMGGVDGSHYNGLDRVPFNGYMAQLHKNERVLTASEATAMDTMSNSDFISMLKAIAVHTAKTARQLERWDFIGLPEERVFA